MKAVATLRRLAALPRRIVLRIRVARLEHELTQLLRERDVIMDQPGATTRWTTDALEIYAKPIRGLQLRVEAIWKELNA